MLELLPYVPADRHQAELLEEALLEKGTSETLAAAIPRRLWRHGELGIPSTTRTAYRRELMRLDGPPWAAQASEEAVTVASALRAHSSVGAPFGRPLQPALAAAA